MVLSVLYVWCQLNKDVIVNFWFGSRFKAMYLPWVLLGMNFILSSGYDIISQYFTVLELCFLQECILNCRYFGWSSLFLPEVQISTRTWRTKLSRYPIVFVSNLN